MSRIVNELCLFGAASDIHAQIQMRMRLFIMLGCLLLGPQADVGIPHAGNHLRVGQKQSPRQTSSESVPSWSSGDS